MSKHNPETLDWEVVARGGDGRVSMRELVRRAMDKVFADHPELVAALARQEES